MNLRFTLFAGATAALIVLPSSLCRADSALMETDDSSIGQLAPMDLQLDLAAVFQHDPPPGNAGRDQPASSPDPSVPSSPKRPDAYGRAGSQWWTIGLAVGNDLHVATDFNLHIDYSIFIADDLEFALEGAGWYFHQNGDDTEGLSASMIFRWHFLRADDHSWTVFGDVGIGLLAAFDNVPDGGTGFDFLPRIGIGFTKALNDSVDGESRGPRLMVGLRYHHISNARIASDTRNPARDAVCVYAAVTFPF